MTQKYENITKEKIEEFLNDIYLKPNDSITKDNEARFVDIIRYIAENPLTDEEVEERYGKLDNKLEVPAMFRISKNVMTGRGGAVEIVKAMRESGFSEYHIQLDLEVLVNNQWYSILYAKVIDKRKDAEI